MSRRGAVLRQEPLLLFLVVGGLLFFGWSSFGPRRHGTIRIERSTLRALEAQQEELLGRTLTGEERDRIREGQIDDEVLLREAFRRGLHLGDDRVRKRLLGVMRSSLTEIVPDPSVAQLQAYFRDHVDDYMRPESTTLEQVYFPWGHEISPEEIESILGKLRSGADPEAYGANSVIVGRRILRQTRADLVRFYGADFADRVAELAAGEWHGPIESTVGVHLVRVEERHPPQTPAFEDVESSLRDDWRLRRAREQQQRRVDEIRKGFRVELVDD